MPYSRMPWRDNTGAPAGSQYLDRTTRELSKAACPGPAGVQEVLPRLVDRIADQRNLWAAFDHIRRVGGPTPGPDGLRIDDLTRSETWALIRACRAAILNGTYRHGPTRTCKIPKPAGRGEREIVVPNLNDRVIARAIAQLLDPVVDAGLAGASYCRPGRGLTTAVADALNLAEAYRLHHWVVADIQSAFPSVPIKRLREILAKRLPDNRLLELLGRIIEANPVGGLAQGSALSPLLLDVHLDHNLDHKWRRQAPRWPFIRYVDDILVLCPTAAEAEEAYRTLQGLLRAAGFKLKLTEQPAVRDLSIGDRADWLGLRFDLNDDGIRVRLPLDGEPGGFWDRFEDDLLDLHDRPEAALLFPQFIDGKFLGLAAPTYPHHSARTIHAKVRDISRGYGFDEMPTVDFFDRRWCAQYSKWNDHRRGRVLPDLGSADSSLSLTVSAVEPTKALGMASIATET